MVSPVAESYTALSGAAVVRGGIAAPGGGPGPGTGGAAPSNNWVALIGDSITDDGVGVGPFQWQNGLSGGLFKLALNAGYSGTKIGYWSATGVNNAWNGANPGLSGLAAQLGVAKIGTVIMRLGTNDADGGALNPTIQAQIDSLIASCLGYGEKLWIMAVPPMGGTEAAYNANVPAYNAYYQAKAAADSTHIVFIDDTAPLYSGASANNSLMDAKGTHPLSAGTRLMGIDGAAQFASLMSGYGWASPLITDPAHVYPAHPQWVRNPTMAGTGGTAGTGFTGQVANYLTIAGTGGGITGTCSIVAADVGDPNTTPWQRISIATTAASQVLDVTHVGAGRTITTSDPSRLEQVIQVRLNGLNLNNWTRLRTWVQDDTLHRMAPDLSLRLGGGGTQTHTLVLRQSARRPTAFSSGNPTMHIYFEAGTTASGLSGSFDIRSFSVEG